MEIEYLPHSFSVSRIPIELRFSMIIDTYNALKMTEAIWNQMSKPNFLISNTGTKSHIPAAPYSVVYSSHRNLRPAVNRQPGFPPGGLVEQRSTKQHINRATLARKSTIMVGSRNFENLQCGMSIILHSIDPRATAASSNY